MSSSGTSCFTRSMSLIVEPDVDRREASDLFRYSDGVAVFSRRRQPPLKQSVSKWRRQMRKRFCIVAPSSFWMRGLLQAATHLSNRPVSVRFWCFGAINWKMSLYNGVAERKCLPFVGCGKRWYVVFLDALLPSFGQPRMQHDIFSLEYRAPIQTAVV